MPTSGPTEEIELAILLHLASQYPGGARVGTSRIGGFLPESIPNTEHQFISEILVGMIKRGQIQVDPRESGIPTSLSKHSFHTGISRSDCLRQHLQNNGTVVTLISLAGLEQRDRLS